jgi:hypothetical protein
MPELVCEPTIPASERAETVHVFNKYLVARIEDGTESSVCVVLSVVTRILC